MSSELENISKFVEQNLGFEFRIGYCGFVRPCVGILETSTDHWVSYDLLVGRDYVSVGISKVAEKFAPKDAYHKHPCLAVLIHDNQKAEATRQLNEWLGEIIKGGYKTKTFKDFCGMGALTGGQTLTGVVDV